MTIVNRKLSMKLMISNARDPDSNNACQYIFITPQDITSMLQGMSGPGVFNFYVLDVRIHRMNDPERGQTIIQ